MNHAIIHVLIIAFLEIQKFGTCRSSYHVLLVFYPRDVNRQEFFTSSEFISTSKHPRKECWFSSYPGTCILFGLKNNVSVDYHAK